MHFNSIMRARNGSKKSPATSKTISAKIPNASNSIDIVLFNRHDAFNLIFIPICLVVNIIYFSTTAEVTFTEGSFLPSIVNKSLNAETFGVSLNYWVFQLYVIADTLWLILYPKSVPSAPAIIYHHLGVLVGWNMPIFDQQWSFWASLAALIESNTFFLVLKRQQGKDIWAVHALFYITWILWRCIVYPLCLVYFSIDYYTYSTKQSHTFLNSGLALEVLLLFLNILNIKWTFDLVSKWGRGATASQSPRDSAKHNSL